VDHGRFPAHGRECDKVALGLQDEEGTGRLANICGSSGE
jgi:hypothetical protein